MNRGFLLVIMIIGFLSAIGQTNQKATKSPKLIVGMMVDQMRWDFIYRYQHRYGEGGFKRILREGFTNEDAHIPYAQTVTAVGHACVYTGSVPALNGIMGNEWYDRRLKRSVYCVEDDSVQVVGGKGNFGPMSPRNLQSTSIADELNLATNFRSKIVGVALKDRGSILPAGRSGNAYWYESTSGNFITSTWYMNNLPNWAASFNSRKVVDSLYDLPWSLSYPFESYVQSDQRNPSYTKNPFPRNFSSNKGKSYAAIATTPWGNTLTMAFSIAAIEGEQLGIDSIPDLLAISLSTPDYIGHSVGPNSVEIEDVYIKLDRELANFFTYLDKKVGKGQYLFFLTADHGVAHVPAYMQSHNLPAKAMRSNKNAEQATMKKFGLSRLVEATANHQVYLDRHYLDSMKADYEAVKRFYIDRINEDPDVLFAFDNVAIAHVNLPAEYREMFQKGYNRELAGDVQVVHRPGYIYSSNPAGTTHGSMYPYDSHIPLLWMGWGVKQGISHRRVYMSDIAGTVTAMLKIQAPSGNVGTIIYELIK